jgi:hypothetical protein
MHVRQLISVCAVISMLNVSTPSVGQARLSGKSQAVPGPVAGTKITEQYARLIARDAFFWAWPMVNVYNRRLAFKDLSEPGLMGSIVPVAPLNRLSMLTDYIEPQERLVACPN